VASSLRNQKSESIVRFSVTSWRSEVCVAREWRMPLLQNAHVSKCLKPNTVVRVATLLSGGQ